ncbi:MAG: hypothetical protein ABSC95_30335 [Acetobacteraceae bacterium]|jgi:hypothetical protein
MSGTDLPNGRVMCARGLGVFDEAPVNLLSLNLSLQQACPYVRSRK